MSKNNELVRSLYEDCLNPRALERLPEVLHEDFIGAGGERGAAGFRLTVERMVAAFPDLIFVIEDLFGDGDRVCVRWRFDAVHMGEFVGLAPTKKPVTQYGIAIYQVRDGKLSQAWLQVDRLGVLQQIGAIA